MALGPSGLKMVFTLLTEVIAFYMQIAIIEIRILSLERPIQIILLRFYWSWSRNRLVTVVHLYLYELPENVNGRYRR